LGRRVKEQSAPKMTMVYRLSVSSSILQQDEV
jgi:hypothetical protein